MNRWLTDSLLAISTSTKAEWEATTFPIPDGMLCYETDTGDSKVGNGDDLYSDLYTAFDAIPVALRELIDSGKLVYAVDGVIPTSYFPSDVFNIHVAVPNIAARNALDIEVIRNSQMVVVVDATGDPTVKLGMAFYVAKFSDDTTYTWIKVGEQESIDLDLSQYLKIVDATIDDIDDSAIYKRTTQKELDAVASALQVSDDYTVDLADFNYWYDFDNNSLIFHITGYNSNGVVDEINSPEYPIIKTTQGSVTIDNSITHNNKSTIYVPRGNNYLGIRTTGSLQLLSKTSAWTVDFDFSLRETAYNSGECGIFGYYRQSVNHHFNRFFLYRVSVDRIRFGSGYRYYDASSITPGKFHRITIVHDTDSSDIRCYIGNANSINNYEITLQNSANWYEDGSGSAISIGTSPTDPNQIYGTGSNWSEFKIYNKAIHPQYSSVIRATI